MLNDPAPGQVDDLRHNGTKLVWPLLGSSVAHATKFLCSIFRIRKVIYYKHTCMESDWFNVRLAERLPSNSDYTWQLATTDGSECPHRGSTPSVGVGPDALFCMRFYGSAFSYKDPLQLPQLCKRRIVSSTTNRVIRFSSKFLNSQSSLEHSLLSIHLSTSKHAFRSDPRPCWPGPWC